MSRPIAALAQLLRAVLRGRRACRCPAAAPRAAASAGRAGPGRPSRARRRSRSGTSSHESSAPVRTSRSMSRLAQRGPQLAHPLGDLGDVHERRVRRARDQPRPVAHRRAGELERGRRRRAGRRRRPAGDGSAARRAPYPQGSARPDGRPAAFTAPSRFAPARAGARRVGRLDTQDPQSPAATAGEGQVFLGIGDEPAIAGLRRAARARLPAGGSRRSSELALEPLLDELLTRAKDILGVDTVAILLLDDDARELVARAAKGLEEEVERGVRIPLGGGLRGAHRGRTQADLHRRRRPRRRPEPDPAR